MLRVRHVVDPLSGGGFASKLSGVHQTGSSPIAEALREWIPDVVQFVDPWVSDQDIEAGANGDEKYKTSCPKLGLG